MSSLLRPVRYGRGIEYVVVLKYPAGREGDSEREREKRNDDDTGLCIRKFSYAFTKFVYVE